MKEEELKKLNQIMLSEQIQTDDMSFIVDVISTKCSSKGNAKVIDIVDAFYKCYMGVYGSAEYFIRDTAEYYSDNVPNYICDFMDFKKIADDLSAKGHLITVPAKHQMHHVFMFYDLEKP